MFRLLVTVLVTYITAHPLSFQTSQSERANVAFGPQGIHRINQLPLEPVWIAPLEPITQQLVSLSNGSSLIRKVNI